MQQIKNGYEGVNSWWLNPWTTYDSEHFFSIARGGYNAETVPFFPLYPLLLKLAGPNDVAMALWGLVLSNVAFVLALIALHRLTSLDHNERTARLAVWLLAFSPLTCVFSAVYTESVFLLCLVSSFLFARQNRWGRAGVLGGLAALTRNSGPLIFVALLLQWLHARRQDSQAAEQTQLREENTPAATQGGTRSTDIPASLPDGAPSAHPVSIASVLFCALPLLGFAAFQGYVAMGFGGLAGVSSHGIYGRALMWPWLPIWNDAMQIFTQRANLTTWLNLGVTLAVFVLLARNWKRQPLAYSLLMLGIIAMQLIYGRAHPVYTNSSLRFMSTTFPFVQLLALELVPVVHSNSRLRPAFLCVGALALLLFCARTSYGFGLKHFVTG